MSVTILARDGALMNSKNVGSCRGCGAVIPQRDVESPRCSRCDMVAELISELVQKQAHRGLQLCRETAHAPAG